MKKISLIVLAAIFGIATASAQFEQGAKSLTARTTGLGFESVSNDGNAMYSKFNLGVAGTYFVIDKLAVVAGVDVNYVKPDGIDATTTIDFEVGARYYVWEALFAGVSYVGESVTDEDLQSNVKINVGYTWYLTENVFFEPTLYYQLGFAPEENKINVFGLQVGIGVNF